MKRSLKLGLVFFLFLCGANLFSKQDDFPLKGITRSFTPSVLSVSYMFDVGRVPTESELFPAGTEIRRGAICFKKNRFFKKLKGGYISFKNEEKPYVLAFVESTPFSDAQWKEQAIKHQKNLGLSPIKISKTANHAFQTFSIGNDEYRMAYSVYEPENDTRKFLIYVYSLEKSLSGVIYNGLSVSEGTELEACYLELH